IFIKMTKDKKKNLNSAITEMSSEDIMLFANHTASWYKAVFLQYKRFTENQSAYNGRLESAFDNDGIMPSIVERTYFVSALNHTWQSIENLNKALKARSDERLDNVIKEMLNDRSFKKNIGFIRNTYEHFWEYELGAGREQKKFSSITCADGLCVSANTHWFLEINNESFIGNVSVDEIMKPMEQYRDAITECLKSIDLDYGLKGANDRKNENGIG
ncbi:MAG: hypothetical protein J6X38_03600, partial [Abditibacteriota bacterium]|nr:hypothetical protein [Abditibacteriota bacterium]